MPKMPMPVFSFKLYASDLVIDDVEGTALPDASAAYEEACRLARELMRNRERQTRHGRFNTCDAEGKRRVDPPVDADPTLDGLGWRTRDEVRRARELMAELGRTVAKCRATVLQSRAIVAQLSGRPYLAMEHGHRLV